MVADSQRSPKLRSWMEMDFKGSSCKRLTLQSQLVMVANVLSLVLIWADTVNVSN